MSLEEEARDPLAQSNDHEWVENIIEILEVAVEEDDQLPAVSIFSIPQTLLSTKKEAYTPQQVALGPYHHRRSDLYEMERYKVSSARRMQNQLKNCKFRDIVDRFIEHENRVRAYYHKYLDFSGETLAWMLAVDTSFLLEYLQTFESRAGAAVTRISSNMLHLIDYNGRKLVHQAILRDIIMLENQIPLFLLRELLGFHHHCNPHEVLTKMVKGLLKVLSPIKSSDAFPLNEEEFKATAHLLEVLYYSLVPQKNPAWVPIAVENNVEDGKQEVQEKQGFFSRFSTSASNALSCLISAPISCIRGIMTIEGIKVIVQLPLQIIRQIRGVRTRDTLQTLLKSVEGVVEEVDSSDSQKDSKPLVEELTIPNVTQLSNIGIKFRPAMGGLTTIKFDRVSTTLYLPVIDLDENSEVVMRNLVAYEASIAPEVMTFARFIDLMKGIIDSEEDVKLLRKAGVFLNHLKSDAEVLTLWDGITKSVTTTKVGFLDEAIQGINSYYNAKWNVRADRFMKKYVLGSWKVLTFLAANILLLLSALEAFCTVYSCSRRLPWA